MSLEVKDAITATVYHFSWAMGSTNKKSKGNILPYFSSPFYKIPSTKKVLDQFVRREDLKAINVLNSSLKETESKRNAIVPHDYIVHLFNRDFRIRDNAGLFDAWELARKSKVPLVTLYVFCREELYSHVVSPFLLHYQLRSLEVLHRKLRQFNVPLCIVEVEKKEDVSKEILNFMNRNKASHLFSNIQYEVDELMTFSNLVRLGAENGVNFQPQHDVCVVRPGQLVSKSRGTPYAVFTPWYKAWCQKINSDGLGRDMTPELALQKVETSFESEIPKPPIDKELSQELIKNIELLYCFGEDDAWEAMKKYVSSSKIKQYGNKRDLLEDDVTSHLSLHISNGTLSCKSIVRYILQKKLASRVDQGDAGILSWIREIAWRDFYKHILCNWPYVCMFKPFLLEFDDIKWENDKESFQRWCEGKTGYPIVDAAMRQLNQTGYMPNRCRMIVASFLSKHLLVDWRYGEKYFMESLIDGDFASNNGGWGFSASVGVDPQPYFRIFNPWIQSEKFDHNGTYIKKWVPELKDVQGKAIHNPYERGYGKLADKNGYSKPIVEHSFARERALERFKQAKY